MTSRIPNVIDLATVRARRGDYLGRLRLDRYTPKAIRVPEPAHEFAKHDLVEDRATKRKGIIAGIVGADHYDVIFYTGRADDPGRVTRWGFQLRAITRDEEVEHALRTAGLLTAHIAPAQESEPEPPTAA